MERCIMSELRLRLQRKLQDFGKRGQHCFSERPNSSKLHHSAHSAPHTPCMLMAISTLVTRITPCSPRACVLGVLQTRMYARICDNHRPRTSQFIVIDEHDEFLVVYFPVLVNVGIGHHLVKLLFGNSSRCNKFFRQIPELFLINLSASILVIFLEQLNHITVSAVFTVGFPRRKEHQVLFHLKAAGSCAVVFLQNVLYVIFPARTPFVCVEKLLQFRCIQLSVSVLVVFLEFHCVSIGRLNVF
mmetsp:Transcript_16249/g.32937  ORF Transcript_16249/g.32937 Transcript_16249/m.32937 type:complete len:244 (+) Transcript_16249:44-775(+)